MIQKGFTPLRQRLSTSLKFRRTSRRIKVVSPAFTAVELLITLFIAAAFLTSGYQLYSLIIKDGGETRSQARANNVAYDYLQRYKANATSPCITQTPLTDSTVPVADLSDVTVSVVVTCPYASVTSISKILVTVKYNTPQQTVSSATYVNDAIDSYTILLLHADGTDVSTTFTDSELTPKTVTAVGNAQIDTAQKKFGSASGLFDGTNSYLSAISSADWDFGTGDWTIDFWIQRNGTQANYVGCVSGTSNALTGWQIVFGGSGTDNRLTLTSKASGGWANDIVSNADIANTTWTHVAVVRNGNTATMYFNGTSVGTKNVAGYNYNSSSTGIVIGANATNGGPYYNGWFDEIRISKGIARWTTNFTPPTQPYSI